LPYRSPFGGWTVKVVNEFDRRSRDARDMLLTMLDWMPPDHAFLATTNLDIGVLFAAASLIDLPKFH
jgi:hypothetical protein